MVAAAPVILRGLPSGIWRRWSRISSAGSRLPPLSPGQQSPPARFLPGSAGLADQPNSSWHRRAGPVGVLSQHSHWFSCGGRGRSVHIRGLGHDLCLSPWRSPGLKTHDTFQSIERDAVMELLSTSDLEGVLNQADAFHATQAFFDGARSSDDLSLSVARLWRCRPPTPPSQASRLVLLLLLSAIQAPGDWPVLARSALRCQSG